MPAWNTDVGAKMKCSRADRREPSTDLPEFYPQCSALLSTHWSVLSKHLHALLQLILGHAAELSRCPSRRKRPSDVSTARHWRCPHTPQRKQTNWAQRGDTTRQHWRSHRTSGPPARSVDNPSNEALSLLSQKLLVHTLIDTSLAHPAVLPLPLSQQHQLHSVFIQHHLPSRKQHGRALQMQPNQYYILYILMRTSGIELMCLVERESTSLPKCSTSPTCHLDGSLENKCNSDSIGAIKGCSWPFHVGLIIWCWAPRGWGHLHGAIFDFYLVESANKHSIT